MKDFCHQSVADSSSIETTTSGAWTLTSAAECMLFLLEGRVIIDVPRGTEVARKDVGGGEWQVGLRPYGRLCKIRRVGGRLAPLTLSAWRRCPSQGRSDRGEPTNQPSETVERLLGRAEGWVCFDGVLAQEIPCEGGLLCSRQPMSGTVTRRRKSAGSMAEEPVPEEGVMKAATGGPVLYRGAAGAPGRLGR